MNGRQLKISTLAILLVGILMFFPFQQGLTASNDLVVILLSDEEASFAQTIATYKNETDYRVEVMNLRGDVGRAASVMSTIFAKKPALILSLGAKAAYVTKVWTEDRTDVPVIFALVLNWKKYQLQTDQPNISGIASDSDPGTQFANLTMCFPEVRRMGVIYNKHHSSHTMERAEHAANLLGLELVKIPIDSPGEFRRAYKQINEKIDSFWVLRDPIVYTMENLVWLEKRCIKDNLVCMGQSENIARLGVVLSVNPDMASIGSQAAAMTKEILKYGLKPHELGVQAPIGTDVTLNMKTIKKLSRKINPEAVNMATTVLDDSTQK